MKNDERLHIRLPGELKKALEKKIEDEALNKTDILIKLIKDFTGWEEINMYSLEEEVRDNLLNAADKHRCNYYYVSDKKKIEAISKLDFVEVVKDSGNLWKVIGKNRDKNTGGVK